MEFDLISFTLAPNVEQLNRCRKDDLIKIANPCHRMSLKKAIKKYLHDELVLQQILPDETVERGAEASAASLVMADEKPLSAPLSSAEPRMLPSSAQAQPNAAVTASDPMLAIKLKELELEVKRAETESKRLRVKELELEIERERLQRDRGLFQQVGVSPIRSPTSPSFAQLPSGPALASSSPAAAVTDPVSLPAFDVSKHINLVPPFREAEVDSYFTAFERVAATLQWPKEMWALLLQCKLIGKAQEVCSALPVEQSLVYDVVKQTVLRAYELVPEAYRQKFRAHKKTDRQTFVEFAREKRTLFDKWCASNKTTTFEQLKEQVLLEDFKSSVSENLVIHLNEQKVVSLSLAAVMADEFVLTHRTVFSPVVKGADRAAVQGPEMQVRGWINNTAKPGRGAGFSNRRIPQNRSGDGRVCFFCLDANHLKADCEAWKKKNVSVKPKSVGFIRAATEETDLNSDQRGFEPFMLSGWVSHDAESVPKPITILRDTGSVQSLMLRSTLNLLSDSYTGSDVILRGVGSGCVTVPLHMIYLQTELVTGNVCVGVCSDLPVEGVQFILGNDLAGGKMCNLCD